MKRLLHHTLYLFNPVHLLACLVTINGYLFLHPSLHHAWHSVPGVIDGFTTWKNALLVFGLLEIPRFMLGLSLMIIGCGLLLRARIAWAFSLLLLLAMMLFELNNPHTRHLLLYATLGNTLLLLWFWRRFHHASLAAGSLFALLSITSLLLYGVLGSLYLGEEFRPHISDLTMAFLLFNRQYVDGRLWRYRAAHPPCAPVYRLHYSAGHHRVCHVGQRNYRPGAGRQYEKNYQREVYPRDA